MELLKIVDKRNVKLKKLEDLTNKAKLEKRELSEEENVEFTEIREDVEILNKQIDEIQKADEAERSEVNTKNNEKKMNTKFNLIEKIKESRNGDTIKLVEERANIVAGTDAVGQDFISEDKVGLIEPLRNKLVLVQAGATFLSGLFGTVSIPAYAGSSAQWKGEVTIAADGAGATTEVTMTPKRLTAFVDVSNLFLLQTAPNVEAMLLSDIVKAVSDKLEATIFSGAIATTTQPAGLFAGTLTNYGAASWSNVVALETAITANNINYASAKYITSAKGAGRLKTAAKASNAALFVLENGSMNGYPVLVTNSVIDTISGVTSNYSGGTEAGIVFADWSQFIIGQWGSIDLIVDAVSQAHYGNTRLVINAYFDAVKRQDGAFAIGSILS